MPFMAAALSGAVRMAWNGMLASARSPALAGTPTSGVLQLGTAAQLASFAQLCAAVLGALALTAAATTWLQRGIFVRFAGFAGEDRELGGLPRETFAERVARSSFAALKWLALVIALIAPCSEAVRGMLGAWQRAPHELSPIAGTLVGSLIERAAIVLAAIGVIDFGVQQAWFRRRLRVSRQQLREEQRATEADPYATAERRRRAREQQTAAVLQELEEVAFVVCDLEARAFALRESENAFSVWVVGRGDSAMRLRAEAIARSLPVVVDNELAFALSAFEIGETLPPTVAARVRAHQQ
jgi:flagellar biosynthetic protein FlhB